MEATPHAGDNQFIGAPKNDSPAPDANVKSWSPLVYVRLYLAEGFYGYLGKSGSQNMWACVVQHKNDAVIIDQVLGKGLANYFWIKDFGYMTWSGGLSGNPVAFNSWAYANMWKFDSGGALDRR
jgi:hypothetical protein